jgi:beta-lysine 5,6-aminomutase alpha subunit
MESKLDLDAGLVEACREAARAIADRMAAETADRTTLSVERSVARFLGVDGITELDVPLPNVLIEHVHDGGALGRGIAHWLGNAMVQTGRDAQQIAEAVGVHGP